MKKAIRILIFFYIVFAFWFCESGECFVLFVEISMVLKEIVIESESMFKSRLCLLVYRSFDMISLSILSFDVNTIHPVGNGDGHESVQLHNEQLKITIIAMEPEKIANLFLQIEQTMAKNFLHKLTKKKMKPEIIFTN